MSLFNKLVILALSWLALTATAAPPSVLFVFDASGSMWAEMEDGHRITVAREVMREVVGQLPEGSHAGLVAYGHSRRGDCEDIETLIPMGPLDRDSFVATVDGINPRGMTPITAAVAHAADLLRVSEQAVSIVLISDGLENCGGDPCAAVRSALDQGIQMQFHVVGFAMGSEDTSELQCMAEVGGGRYVAADSAAELNLALTSVLVEPEPEVTTPDDISLIIGVVRHGLSDITGSVQVINLADGREIISPSGTDGWLGRSSADNPRGFSLPAGRYDVLVQADGIARAARWIRDLQIEDGQVVERIVDFTPGELTVAATGNGELLEQASVTLLDARDASVVIAAASPESWMGHGGRPHPRTYELLPGIYDLRVVPDQVLGASSWIRGITIEPGQAIEQRVDFAIGTLKVEVAGNGVLMERGAVHLIEPKEDVAIIRRDSTEGWMGQSSRPHPRSYLLPVGVYDLWLQAPEIQRASMWFRGVEITAGETVERRADFEFGYLTVSILANGQLVPEGGSMTLVRQEDGQEIINRSSTEGWIGGSSGRPHPRTHRLQPGTYDLWLGSAGPGRQSDWIRGVEIRAGETQTQSIDISAITP